MKYVLLAALFSAVALANCCLFPKTGECFRFDCCRCQDDYADNEANCWGCDTEVLGFPCLEWRNACARVGGAYVPYLCDQKDTACSSFKDVALPSEIVEDWAIQHVVNIHNFRKEMIKVYWKKSTIEKGIKTVEEVHFFDVAPQGHEEITTMTSHEWVARTLKGRFISSYIINPLDLSGQQFIVGRAPPNFAHRIPWQKKEL